ncbi:MAG TPA: sugar transferase [Candidatus Omnitrophota bacterium]|nr:sugar transferase [Candidatus Omnitrophota bacterium]HRZ14832.1 sugar transferase [Candidatus Omnitrophota bacterium]
MGSQLKKISFVVILLGFLFVLEPALRNKVTFAVPFFSNSQVDYEKAQDLFVETPAIAPAAPQKGRAPEPATLILFLGGIGGIMMRYVRFGFAKIKRVMDLVLAVVGLTLSAPVVIFAAALIKLDSPGPVIYQQKRLGKHGKVFKIYKLRTMGCDAEKNSGAVWAKKNDPRITPVGRLLRKTRIDEIPQLLNVFKGEMSIVGPRPERPELVRDLKVLISDYEKRLSVKPGITGMAQVLHKYDESIDDVRTKVSYDLMYIRNMRLSTDLQIMARTFGVVLTGKGAN